MSDRGTDAELSREVGALIDALEDLQQELGPADRERRRLPTPRDLLRFTSEVTIPGAIIVLETNVRVLKLLQRTIRMTAGESPTSASAGTATADAVRGRAEALGRQTIEQLERTLADLQSDVAAGPTDGDTANLLEEARRLQDRVQADLAETPTDDRSPLSDESRSTGVNIDVESELESIRDQIDDEDSTDNHQDDDR